MKGKEKKGKDTAQTSNSHPLGLFAIKRQRCQEATQCYNRLSSLSEGENQGIVYTLIVYSPRFPLTFIKQE